MNHRCIVAAVALAVVQVAAAQALEPVQPTIAIGDRRADEKPVAIETSEQELEHNGLFRRVKTSLVFTNPNRRVMGGELEFPLPEGAVVCGYALEVGGVMVPGVVTVMSSGPWDTVKSGVSSRSPPSPPAKWRTRKRTTSTATIAIATARLDLVFK